MELFWRYLDGGIAVNPGDSLEQARLLRVRLVNAVSALFIVIASPFVVLHLVNGEMAAVSLGLSIFLSGANVLLLRKTHWVSVCGLIFTSLILAHLSVLALEVRHPAIAYWFFMVPLLGALLGGLRVGWLLTGVVLLVALFQEMVPLDGPRELSDNHVFAMRVISTLCVAVFMTIFATAQRAAERSQREANQELLKEVARGRLMREVAAAANSAVGVHDVLEACVGSVCRLANWPVGVAWTVGDWEEERASKAWNLRDDGFAGLRTGAERIWSQERCILAQRPAEETLPSWIGSPTADLDPEFAEIVLAAGLSGGVIVPVLDEGQVVSRLAFFWGRETQPDSVMLDVLENLSAQIAHVVVRTRAQARIQTLAFFDPVTGLPNRQLFQRRLLSALEVARRLSHPLALLYIDLDGFKSVNDSLGHAAGDRLLKKVACRLVEGVRSSDAVLQGKLEDPSPLISRLAGDEFTITLSKISDSQDAGRVAQRLLDSLAEPFEIERHEVYISASIGVAIYPVDGDHSEALLAASDVAMYHAKKMGRNQLQYYAESMNVHRVRTLEVEARLRRALDRGDLTLHYQPFRDTAVAKIAGAEALLRWQDEELGDVSPAEFIPIAERTGLIVPIGSWVLQTACEQMQAWQNEGYRPLRISVNISGIQLRRPGLVEEVELLLTAHRLSPAQLELEITESTIMQEDETTRRNLEAIQCLGVGIALDDFGTGFSSLSYLRRFPIGCVKIDRSFVSGIPENPADEALTGAVIAMAHSLGLRVVAEGVETPAQAEFLRSHGCDELQGFLFGHPVPADEFVRWLERDKPDEGESG